MIILLRVDVSHDDNGYYHHHDLESSFRKNISSTCLISPLLIIRDAVSLLLGDPSSYFAPSAPFAFLVFQVLLCWFRYHLHRDIYSLAPILELVLDSEDRY